MRLKGDHWWGYFFAGPTLLGIIILNIYPMFSTLIVSFQKSVGLSRNKSVFVGLSNYQNLVSDPVFWQSTYNTILFTLLTVPLSVVIALILAGLLNSNIKGRGIFRTLYFTPVVVPGVAVGLIWNYLLQAKFGIVNQLLGTNIAFTADSHFAIYTIAAIGVWASVGYYIILFIAGMQGISETYYEAAELDGATPIQKFFSITLPLLSPTTFMVVILAVISGLQIFDIPLIMVDARNPAYNETRPLLEFFYRYSFTANKPGIASAVVVFLVVIIVAITLIQFRLQKRWVHYES